MFRTSFFTTSWPRTVFINIIRLYRLIISPWLAPCCRFYPSCSVYAEQAFRAYGVIKGLFLTLRRLSCCHPFHPGGYNPIPEEKRIPHGY